MQKTCSRSNETTPYQKTTTTKPKNLFWQLSSPQETLTLTEVAVHGPCSVRVHQAVRTNCVARTTHRSSGQGRAGPWVGSWGRWSGSQQLPDDGETTRTRATSASHPQSECAAVPFNVCSIKMETTPTCPPPRSTNPARCVKLVASWISTSRRPRRVTSGRNVQLRAKLFYSMPVQNTSNHTTDGKLAHTSGQNKQ